MKSLPPQCVSRSRSLPPPRDQDGDLTYQSLEQPSALKSNPAKDPIPEAVIFFCRGLYVVLMLFFSFSKLCLEQFLQICHNSFLEDKFEQLTSPEPLGHSSWAEQQFSRFLSSPALSLTRTCLSLEFFLALEKVCVQGLQNSSLCPQLSLQDLHKRKQPQDIMLM